MFFGTSNLFNGNKAMYKLLFVSVCILSFNTFHDVACPKTIVVSELLQEVLIIIIY